jgi:lipopolysaccharide transport system permease protein
MNVERDLAAARAGFELRGEITPVGELISNLWRSRSLIRMLSRRNFYVKYRRTSFGMLWSIALPLIQATVMSVIFTKIVRIRTAVPYPAFALAGILPWTFFSSTLGDAVRSITGGSSMASKVYFPRAALPLVSVGSNLYSWAPNVLVLLAVVPVFGIRVSTNLLYLVPGTIALLALSSVFALVVGALQVYFRDMAYIVMAALQPWFFASAVVFPVQAAHGKLRTLIIANPGTGMIELFRVAFLGLRSYSVTSFEYMTAWLVALAVVALFLYRRFDRVFIDLL